MSPGAYHGAAKGSAPSQDILLAEAGCRVTSYGDLPGRFLYEIASHENFSLGAYRRSFTSTPLPLTESPVVIVQRLENGPTVRIHSRIHRSHHLGRDACKDCIEARI